jgi:hypothetical protein
MCRMPKMQRDAASRSIFQSKSLHVLSNQGVLVKPLSLPDPKKAPRCGALFWSGDGCSLVLTRLSQILDKQENAGIQYKHSGHISPTPLNNSVN